MVPTTMTGQCSWKPTCKCRSCGTSQTALITCCESLNLTPPLLFPLQLWCSIVPTTVMNIVTLCDNMMTYSAILAQLCISVLFLLFLLFSCWSSHYETISCHSYIWFLILCLCQLIYAYVNNYGHLVYKSSNILLHSSLNITWIALS